MTDDLDKKYLTINNFKIRFDNGLGNDPSMLLGYLYSIDTIMPELKKIIDTAETFDELKQELLKNINSHIQLRNSIDASREDDDISNYDLSPKPSNQ